MTDLTPIQACISNRLDPRDAGAGRIAAIIGDSPSRYSKSPALWNAAFQALAIDAAYVALDVEGGRLADLMAAVRRTGNVLGLNVTVPHKLAVAPHLDALEESARLTGAVNTITRAAHGRLSGANTDGAGFVESLLAPPPGGEAPLIESLESLNGISALVLGAGGSARAVAFALGGKIGRGRLDIANRTYESAAALAVEVAALYGNAAAIREEEIPEHARRAGLIVNCTTRGQGGGALEAYSALAPARPEAGKDIEANNRTALTLAREVPPATVFYDLVYHPEETVFLRHARLTGHRAQNGQAMIVAQAVEAFFSHICRAELERAGLHTEETRKRLLEIMTDAW